jgi:nitroreductase
MDLFSVIKKRRSCRQFDRKPVRKPDLEKIVDAARLAPSGYNIQPWHFIVVTDPDSIQRISKADEWIADAGAVILVVMDPTESDFIIEDASSAIVSMLLAATALGYGSCWVEGDVVPFENEFKKSFSIPEELKLFAMVPIGVHSAQVTPKDKKSLTEVLHWDSFSINKN